MVPALYRHPRWLAVFGPLHADPELGLPRPYPPGMTHTPSDPHWHIDWRFVPDEHWEARGYSVGNPKAMALILYPVPPTERPEWRRMKCKRAMPEFPAVQYFAAGPPQLNRVVAAMQRALAGKRLNLKTMLCPHRGLCLRGLPVTERGTVICPGHGSEWSLATGELVSRLPARPAQGDPLAEGE